ncbi:hypothetical protein GW17_00025389 [Ensete ventricosum]|nr:hypothetical protein GW17_00025389 [Ensete ventricosum]
MRLGTRQECIGSSLRVSGVCQDGAREFARRRPRLVRRLLRVVKKLTGSYDGLVMDFARRFTEGIGKLARNMSGDCRKKTIGLTARIPEATGLTGVKSMHRVDAVGNLPGVRWELAEGIESLLGWCKGVLQKKTETHRKIIRDSRKACKEFTEGIRKLAGNTSGDHRKKTRRLTARMPEVVGLAGVNRPYPGVRAIVNRPYLVCPGMFDFWLQKSEATWGL